MLGRSMRAMLALAVLLGARAAGAQIVRGDVVEEGSGGPLAGVLVALVAADGSTAVAGLSDEEGRFALRAPRAGRYTLRAKRIGIRQRTGAPFDLATGETRAAHLVLSALPAVQPVVAVTGTTECIGNPAANQATAALWEDARAALAATTMTRRLRQFAATVSHVVRELDPVSLRVRKEQKSPPQSGSAERPFFSAPAGDLSRNGYVRALADGSTSFFAPDAEVLLSDAFIGDHCFRVERGTRKEEHLIGLAFEPVPSRTRPDVRGVLWLDARTRDLKRLDYRYMLLPNGMRVDRAGGVVHFARVQPWGVWVVEQWSIRMPMFAKLNAQAGLGGQLGRNTRDTLVAFHEEGGILTAPGLAPRLIGSLAGLVFDSTSSAPLAGATVVLVGTKHSAITDASGRYRIAAIDEGEYAVEVQHARLDSLGVFVAPRDVAVQPGAERTLDFAAPRAAVVATNGTYALRGLVVDERSGAPVPGVEIVVGVAKRATTDSSGAFLLSNPTRGRVAFFLRKLGYEPLLQTAELAMGDTATARYGLAPVSMLAGVSVTTSAVASSARLEGFERRKSSAGGRFLTSAEIEKRGSVRVSDLIAGTLGVRVIDSLGVPVAISSRSMKISMVTDGEANEARATSCVMRIAVDGLMRPPGTSLNDVAPRDIHGIEIYSGANMPREFPVAGADSQCGLIVIWTKVREKP